MIDIVRFFFCNVIYLPL